MPRKWTRCSGSRGNSRPLRNVQANPRQVGALTPNRSVNVDAWHAALTAGRLPVTLVYQVAR